MDLRLEKSRSVGTGAAPVVAVQANAGVTVPAAAAELKTGVCRWGLLDVLASHFVHLTQAVASLPLCAGCDLVPVCSGNDPGQGFSIRQPPQL